MSNTDTRIIDVLRTPNAILAVLAIALIAQIPHAADVFHWAPYVLTGKQPCAEILHCPGLYVHSYLFAIALEAAVLLFVIWHRHWESLAFAVVSILMNLSYYFLQGIHLFDPAVLPAWLVSIALPGAIALYSHTVGAIEQRRRSGCATVKTKTVRDTRTVEQSEITIVPDDEQSPEQAAEQSTAIVPSAEWSDEQKRLYLAELLNAGNKPNKTRLARELGIGRTTLYTWIDELQAS